MTMFHTKKRVVVITLLLAFMVTFCVPQISHAQSWGDNPASQIFKTAMEEMTKIIDQIQKAVVLVVLIQSITTQIEQIIESAGGAIVGTSGWLSYLEGADNSAGLKTRETINALGISTRSVSTTLQQSIGDTGDSIPGRVQTFAEAGITGDGAFGEALSGLSASDFLRNGGIGTVSTTTGKNEFNNIASLTAVLNPANNVMAGQISADMFAKIRDEEVEALKMKQLGFGFDSAEPGRTAAAVSNISQEAIGATMNNLTPVSKTIMNTALNRFMKGLGSPAKAELADVMSVEDDLNRTLNETGGSAQFELNY